MNYFFVHTPFQLIVAQGLIKIKGLEQNTLFLGHTGRNSERQNEVLQKILIESLWQQVYQIGDLHNYVPRLSNLNSFFKVNKALNKLNDKIDRDSTTELFFGDLNAIAYVIMVKYFNVERVSFFEEGLSHYALAILKPKPNASPIKGFVYNLLSKYIISVNSISKYIFNKEASSFDFAINKRYNILNREKNETFDEPLDLKKVLTYGVNPNFGASIKELKDNGNAVIFLSSTIRNIFDNALETEVSIIEKISQLYPSDPVFIKFHPKDNQELNRRIIGVINEKGLNASELYIASEVPVEILFDVIKPKALFGYGSSSQLYFTQVSKETPNRNVLELIDIDYINNQKRGERLASSITNWEKLKTIYL